jgi:hypothetical protein
LSKLNRFDKRSLSWFSAFLFLILPVGCTRSIFHPSTSPILSHNKSPKPPSESYTRVQNSIGRDKQLCAVFSRRTDLLGLYQERMNHLCGCGRRLGLSHLRRFYKTESTRSPRSTRTTTTTFTIRYFRTSAVTMTSKQVKWTAPVVRKTFLEFFEGKGHTVGTWRGSF